MVVDVDATAAAAAAGTVSGTTAVLAVFGVSTDEVFGESTVCVGDPSVRLIERMRVGKKPYLRRGKVASTVRKLSSILLG